jgi:hypothetical protein
MRECDNAVGGEKHALRELGERVHCHRGAPNCPRATVQVVFTECPPSGSEEHCSRTRRSRAGLRGPAQRTHSRTAIGWRSMELVSKLFDTPT